MNEQSFPEQYDQLWLQQRAFKSVVCEAASDQAVISEAQLASLMDATSISDRSLLEGLVRIAREEANLYEQRHGQTPTMLELRTRILARSNNKEEPTEDETLAAQAINTVVDPKTKVARVTLNVLLINDSFFGRSAEKAKLFLTDDVLSESPVNLDEVA